MPEWSLPEETAAEEISSSEEATADEDMDWSSLVEEETLEKPGAPGEEILEGEDLFDFEEESKAPREEPPIPPVDRGFEAAEMEYDIRPAALERHKRRKSKSRILIPLLSILVICAVAGGLIFFISGKEKAPTPAPARPETTVAEKDLPTPAPPPEAKPAEPAASADTSPPVKAIAPTPTTTSGKAYYVQFGAFRSLENAKKLQSQLKPSGYDTFVRESTLKGQPIYLVLLTDKFTDKWTAFKQARQIKNKSNLGTSVYFE